MAEFSSMLTHDEAIYRAERHREQQGDGVTLHDPADDGWGLVCGDCGWTACYDPREDTW